MWFQIVWAVVALARVCWAVFDYGYQPEVWKDGDEVTFACFVSAVWPAALGIAAIAGAIYVALFLPFKGVTVLGARSRRKRDARKKAEAERFERDRREAESRRYVDADALR